MADEDKNTGNGAGSSPANDEEKVSKKDKALLKDALVAFGIDPKFVLSSRVTNDTVTIVMHGGAKVSFKDGDKPEKLDPVRVHGISPNKPRIVAGKKK